MIGISFLYACDDSNDWEVDPEYNQMFRPVKLDTETTGTDSVLITWNGIPGTLYYVMQYAQDSLEFNSLLNFVTNNQDTVHISAVEYALKGLNANTQYSIRLKSVSPDPEKRDSEWAYLTFKTRSEQIFNSIPQADITFNSVRLTWTPGLAVTHITIGDRTINLDSDAIANGEIEITDLDSDTPYTATIYNGNVQRGQITFVTAAEVPEADNYIYLSEGDVISAEIFDGMTGSVTVSLPSGSEFHTTEELIIPDGLAVNFFGIGEMPTLGLKLLDFRGRHEFITFRNLDITGLDKTGAQKSEYFFNMDDNFDVDYITFEDCIIHNYANGAFRVKGGTDSRLGTFRITNSTAYSASNNYALIIVGVAGARFENIVMENSTFYDLNRFITHAVSPNTSTIIQNCTFYDVIVSGQYFFDGQTMSPTSEFIIANTIIAKSKDETARGIRSAIAPSMQNTYKTSDWITSNNTIAGFQDYNSSSDVLFADPENGDFTIIDRDFPGKSTAGATKWRMTD